MKTLRSLFSAALSAFLLFTACEKVPSTPGPQGLSGLVVLNEGSWGGNNSSVLAYDQESGTMVDRFYDANGKNLGDTGQDMIVLGDDIYIAVNVSKIIFVTDRDFRIKKEIIAEKDGLALSPRYFATDGKKVYVTYYEGYLGEIDPAGGYSVRTTPVGPNPEGVAYAGGRLYVANSGGYNYPDYNNTLSVVDAESFNEVSTIEVNVNPCLVFANAAGTTLYVSSLGNYADAGPKLQGISAADGSVTDIDCDGVSAIAYGKGDKLYVLCAGYDQYWNPLPGTVYTYNAATGVKEGTFADGIENAYKVSADPDAGYVFVTASDYNTTGDMYVYSSAGEKIAGFDTQGMNPSKGLVIR